MRLLASEIDGGAFAAAAGMTRFVPVGRGTVSVILKGHGSTWDALLENANGSISASFGQGALSGFDVDGLLDAAQEGGFFALDEVSGGLPIDALDFKASVSDGVATIEKAEARSPLHRIAFPGHSARLGHSRSPARSSRRNRRRRRRRSGQPLTTFRSAVVERAVRYADERAACPNENGLTRAVRPARRAGAGFRGAC